MTDEQILSYTIRMLDETREEVGRADAKAATLLSASAIAVTLLVGVYGLKAHSFRVLPIWRADLALLALGVSGVGVVLLGLAVLPRSTVVAKNRVRFPPYYFGEVTRYRQGHL